MKAVSSIIRIHSQVGMASPTKAALPARPQQEDHKSHQRRMEAQRILDNYEQLVWQSTSRHEVCE